jgi:tripartite-type tricarboxylate transporter receptor subunit TctC
MGKIRAAFVAPIAGLSMLAGHAAQAAGPSAAAFYQNLPEIKMVIGAGPAGSYDIYARILARHMGDHIPGKPNITPMNMPGASGIKAANWVALQGPQDGSILSNIRYNFAMYQALDNLPQVKTDMRAFHWIGSLNATNHVLATYYKAPVKTFDDLRKTQILIGEASPRSFGTLMAEIYNALLGTRLKVITGYGEITKVKLAMDRGEVQGVGDDGWTDLKADFPDMLAKHQLNVLMQVGLAKEPELADAPLLLDQAKGDPTLKAQLEFVTESDASTGKPFATSPGVPADRVTLLRRAFDATMKDPAFLDDAEKAHVAIEPISGEEIQKIIADIRGAPTSVTANVRHALGFDKPQGKTKQ